MYELSPGWWERRKMVPMTISIGTRRVFFIFDIFTGKITFRAVA